ncbi:MAG: DUF883 domain-containing protein [Alphaproteobacteria bacterium]|nr:MAG: DUF883 domain-containing protein [Alphaproteobacteria bacterium]
MTRPNPDSSASAEPEFCPGLRESSSPSVIDVSSFRSRRGGPIGWRLQPIPLSLSSPPGRRVQDVRIREDGGVRRRARFGLFRRAGKVVREQSDGRAVCGSERRSSGRRLPDATGKDQGKERMMADKSYEAEIAALQKDLGALRADVARLVAAFGDDIEAKGAELKEQAQRRLAEARKRSRQALDQVEEAVEDNPLTALAIAVGLGFLVGALLGRR